jgi:hypothetical protein
MDASYIDALRLKRSCAAIKIDLMPVTAQTLTLKLPRIDVIILDPVCRLQDDRFLQTGYAPHKSGLHIFGKTARQPRRVR